MNSDGNENEMTVANNYVTAEQIADHRWSPITELPAIFFAKVGAAVMLNRKRLCRFPFLLDNNTMAYSLSPTKWDADFAKALFGTVDLTSLVQVGALPSYNAGDVESMEIYLPSLLEQEQIGAYFNHLDNLITLHQRQPFLHSTPDISLIVQLTLSFYTFSWEQRKAIDIADYSKGNGYSKGDLTDSGTPIILYGRLYTKYQFAISEVDTFAVPRNGAVYSQGNEVIVPASGETAEDIARASAVEESGVLLGGDLNILRPFDFINPLFLALAISNGEPQKELAKKAQGKSVVHIHNTDIQEVTIAYPSRTEQDRIVSVFRQLDNLITLHQRKCALLFSSFQALISMMFTTSTFSWEQRKFDEVFDCTVPNNTLSRAELSYDEGTVLNVHYGDVLIKYGSVLDVQKDDIPRIPHRCREDFNGALLQDGDVIIADTAEDETTGKACEIGNLQGSAIVSGLHTMVCRPRNRMALGYLGYYLNSNAYHYQLLPLMQGIKVLSLSRSNIQKTSVSYPIAVKEQQLIAYYFRQLDNLITLHQRKCISFTVRAGRLISTVNKKRITSSWEQRKLGELVDRVVRKNTNNESTLPLTISAQYGLVDQITYFNNRVASRDVSNYYLVLNGEFAYNKSTSDGYPFGAVKRLDLYEKGVLSTLYIVFAPKKEQQIDSDYLTVFFDTDRWHKGVAERAAEGARNHGLLNISAEDFFDIDLSVPKDIVEQKQIGAFIRQLDNLITLHQRKPFLMKWRNSDANRNQTNRLVL